MRSFIFYIFPFIMLSIFGNHSFESRTITPRIKYYSEAINQKPKTKIFLLKEGGFIKMIWVNSGTFIMGSPRNELGRTSEREAQHPVKLSKGYWLAETELPQLQWEKVMGSNPSFHKGENLPVDQVSFVDVQDFLKKVNKNRNDFRLPTEAVWEYACRAEEKKGYSTNTINDMVWHSGNSGKQSHPVANKSPNAWDFYDMQGNVLEWCSDWFHEDNTNEYSNPKITKT